MTTARSYLDPVYDQIESSAANQAGIDPALLRSVRTQGERSNADQVSSAGARTVYQIIPNTRAGLMKNYGVDPYASPHDAALGAALLLKEGLRRNNGNVEAAIGEYHGGTDRSQWGPVNAAYRARVMGDAPSAAARAGTNQYNLLPGDGLTAADAGSPSLKPVTIPNPDEAPDSPASIYQPATKAPSQLPAAMPTLSPEAPPNVAPDWSGWLDSYIRNVLNSV
ncbi:transglycosylase SLT domain-containing protein [Paraburkholderia domus]|uniref:Transglycosylase SLT domain-containing protein n=1 Tax=Paraburkholderia domus TaxID=2793075 RepID=A0A9N8R2J8_9BURK|nr:transglycosylase SLT domain-containing protein [Paraburkholderia domus]MBK5162755.1 lytic transglycosylase domain-containing protein [Burkholderia sp. R-70211]CAE6958555.1 hypothetical protein R70211_06764 [Paraburkholderia domus]